MKTTAIIVAAGTGTRFASETPKQFLDLRGKPVIVHSIEAFESSSAISSIILVLAPAMMERFLYSSKKPLSIVAGGDTRAVSVRNGLDQVSDETELVAVHDGARPLVTAADIERTIDRARVTGAACLAAELIDTVKAVHDGEISATVDRTKLRRALTPQVFKTMLLRRAFELHDNLDDVTDECYLVEKLGVPISMIDGDPRNIKITNPDDLAIAELLMGRMEKESE